MIRLDHVTRDYGRLRAVDDVSFEVSPGEIVGFLGPNGAGKSTVLKMISTWLPATRGTIQVAGFDVAREAEEVRRRLGYLPEHNALYDGMRVDGFLGFVSRVHGLGGARARERRDWVVHGCALQEVLGRRIRECSKGFRQRIGLAAALIHDPEVLVLDEPTHGLDPLQVVQFRDFLNGLREGRSILFSSHILGEVLALSDRVVLLHRGLKLADDAPAAFRERAGDGRTEEDVILDLVRAAETDS